MAESVQLMGVIGVETFEFQALAWDFSLQFAIAIRRGKSRDSILGWGNKELFIET